MKEQLREQPGERIRQLTTAEVNRVSGASIAYVILSVWAGPNADIVRGGIAGGIPGGGIGGIGGMGVGLVGMSYASLSEDS